MIGNGGIIGPDNIPTKSLCSGVWNISEQYNSKLDDIWPIRSEWSEYSWSSNLLTNDGHTPTDEPSFCNVYYRRYIITFIITAAEIKACLGSEVATAKFNGLRFYVYEQPDYQPLPSYGIGMKLTTSSITTNVSGSGFTEVLEPSNQSFTTSSNKEISFDNEFEWNDDYNLAFSFAWGQCPTDYDQSGSTYYSEDDGGKCFVGRTDNSGAYDINDSASSMSTLYRPVLQLYYSAYV